MTAYLKGKLVAATEISPEKHRFIGLFRPPFVPYTGEGYVMCACKQILQNQEQYRTHWYTGCFDVAQYVEIE